VTLYEATNSLLLILRGKSHPEELAALLDALHLVVSGISIIAPAVSRISTPPQTNVYLKKLSLADLSSSLIRSILSQDDVFVLLDLNPGAIWMLSPHRTGLFCDPEGSDDDIIAHLAFAVSNEGTPRTAKESQAYDAIASRKSELVNQIIPTVDRNLRDLASKWESFLGEPAPEEIVDARRNLNQFLERLRGVVGGASPAYFMGAITEGDSLASQYARSSTQLLSALDDYGAGHSNYVDQASSLMLRCVKTFADDVSSRLGVDESWRVFPFFSDSDFVMLGMFSPFRSTLQRKIAALGLSRSRQLRLGAIPICAYHIGWLNEPEVPEDSLDLLVKSLLRPSDSDFSARVRRLVDAVMSCEAGSARILRTALSVLSCDLLACATVGPAYVYSIARFVSPISTDDIKASASPSAEGWRRGYPPLGDRISLCLAFLKWRLIEPHFRSMYLQDVPTIRAHEFFEWILSKVDSPYTPEEHDQARGKLKSDLMNGIVVSSRPSLIVNALWDGVVRKSGYVNEMAALASVGSVLPEASGRPDKFSRKLQ
jgi:hypothetical protein